MGGTVPSRLRLLPGRAVRKARRVLSGRDSDPWGAPLDDPELALLFTIPGFFEGDSWQLFHDLADYLAEQPVSILEIGVLCGRSLVALGLAFKQNAVKVVGVDPLYEDFTSSPALEQEDEFLAVASRHLPPSERLAILRAAVEAAREFAPHLPERIELRRLPQHDFLAQRDPAEKFDILHIDGEHTFEAVDEVLRAADGLLNQGAVVIVDDFFNAGFPGIAEAIYRSADYRRHLHPATFTVGKCLFVYDDDAQRARTLAGYLRDRFTQRDRAVRTFADGSIVIQ